MTIKHIAYASDMTDGKVIIRNSMGDQVASEKPKELLDFLGKNYEGYLNRKIAWNIDILLSVVFKKMGLEACGMLASKEEGRLCVFRFDNGNLEMVEPTEELRKAKAMPEGLYRFIYNPRTIAWLSIGGVQYASFFNNTGQYFDSDDDLSDLPLVLEKQKELEDAMYSLGLDRTHQASAAKMWERTVLEHCAYPTIDCINGLSEKDCSEMLDWCEKCLSRVWTVARVIGHFDSNESFDFDLSSAYAYALSQLGNFKYANFIKSSEWVDGADYAILKGKVTIGDIKVSPIAKEEDGFNTYPVGGSWNDFLTLPEVEFIRKWGIGDFELDYGYFWKYPNRVQPPFGVIIPRYYNMRWQDGLVKTLGKKLLSSCWGKFIEKKVGNQPNPYYNPIYALQVQTATRLRVASFIYHYKVQDDVVHIGTDGVRLSRNVDIPDILKLGGWRRNPQEPCIVLSPGRVFSPSKKPGGMYYDDVVEMIKDKPKAEYYRKVKRRRRTLSEAVLMGDISEVGEMRDHEMSFHVTASENENLSYKFDKYPTNGSELLAGKYHGNPVKIE